MPNKNPQTENHIKQTAKTIFFTEGNLHATTQEIADKAGVNRALINYYFRSRNQLFELVMHEALASMFEKIYFLLSAKLPFREKLEQFISNIVDETAEFPYLESFVIAEINRGAGPTASMFPEHVRAAMFGSFSQEVRDEVKKGTIAPVTPEHFIVNMMSMTTYPMLAKPIVKMIFTLDEEGYAQFLQEQKQQIANLIFRQ